MIADCRVGMRLYETVASFPKPPVADIISKEVDAIMILFIPVHLREMKFLGIITGCVWRQNFGTCSLRAFTNFS